MRIETIKVLGLKRADGATIKLDPVTYFHGPNGAGKSTVLDAVKLLCRGEHPDAGRGGTPAKRGDDIMALAAGDVLEVEATVRTAEGLWTLGRKWTRSRAARGAKSGEVSVSEAAWAIPPAGRRIDKKSEAEAAIAKLVGPAAGLDLAELLGPKVTDTDRRRLLLTAAGSRSSWTPATVLAELQRREITPPIVPWKGTPKDPALVDWIQTEWERISEEVSHTHGELLRAREAAEKIQQGQVEGDAPPVDPTAVQAVQQAAVAAEASARQVEGRCALAVQSARTDMERGEERDASRRRLEAQLSTVRGQLQQTQRPGANPRIAQLNALIVEAEDDFADGSLPDLRGAALAATNARERAQQRTGEANQARLTAEHASRQAVDDARSADLAVSEWTRRMEGEVQSRTAAALRDLQVAQREAEPAVEVYRTIKRLLEEAEEVFEDSATCPTCLGKITAVRLVDLQRMADAAQRPVVAAQQALDSLEGTAKAEGQAELRKREQAAEKTRAAVEPARQAYLRADEAHRSLLVKAQGLAEEERRAQAAVRAAEERVARWREELAGAEASSAGTEQATLLERERALKAEIAGIHVPDLAALKRNLDQAEAQARRERQQATDELAEARARLVPLESALTLQREVLRLQAEVERWDLAWRSAQRLEREIGPSGMMGTILAEILGPLEQLVNEGLDGLGLGTFRIRMVDERGRAVCRPGLERGESWTPVETLSDGERASVLPVLLPALATLIGGPWRLLLADSLERIDSGRRTRFLQRVVQLVTEGKIHQAVIAGCSDKAPEVAGLTVITVGARLERVA